MNIKAATATRFLADAALAAIVGTKIYRKDLPRNLTGSYIIISMITKTKHYDHGGDSGLREAFLRVSCYAPDPGTADDIAELVTASLEAWPGESEAIEDVFLEDETDVTDERRGAPHTGTEQAHTALDFKISYTE